MVKFCSMVLGVFFLFNSCFLFDAVIAKAEARKPVAIEEGSPLSLRILVRPQAKLYKGASEENVVDGQLPVFKSYFVYTRPGGEARATGTGWYEVGSDEKGSVVGWMKSSDVFEWKQAMCLAFSHPQGRKPVLMFEEEEPLNELLKKTNEARTEDVNKLYSSIKSAVSTPLSEEFPIISMEPSLAIDITKQFYLLPILEHKPVTMESYEGRLLRIAAVSGKEDAKRDSPDDIRKKKEAVIAATTTEEAVAAAKKDMTFDIVWVIDTTRSMQPYIEEVRNTLEAMSKDLVANSEIGKRIRFGMWAFRDSEEIKDIGYTTKNFTPELQPLDVFVDTLGGVKETETDSVNVNEDLFAGVHNAIKDTAWSENSARLIILVGDAPSHEKGFKWNSSNMDEVELRKLATENKVLIIGIHVKPKIKKRYNRLANRQFVELTKNPGTDGSLFFSLNAGEREKFVENSKTITGKIVSFLEETLEESKNATQADKPATATQNPVSAASAPEKKEEKNAPVEAGKPADDLLHQALRAATVTWLGRATETKAPNDIEAWVTDKDLTDPSTQSLDVRLLISKRQLNGLAIMLDELIVAAQEAQMGTADFFSSLQSVSATAARNADKLANVKSIQEAGIVPAFLQGLPYESQIMAMSSEFWESLGPDEQDQFIENLRGKIAAYKSIHSTPSQWVKLNEGDSADDYVTPIPLELLP